MSAHWTRSPACWAVLARMLVLRATLPALTRALPLERLVRLLAHPRDTPRPQEQELAVRAARRLWRGASEPCLPRSLALYSELGRAGAWPGLRCGVAREGNGVVGHAWVVAHDGSPLETRDPGAIYGTVVAFDGAGGRASAGAADVAPAAPRT